MHQKIKLFLFLTLCYTQVIAQDGPAPEVNAKDVQAAPKEEVVWQETVSYAGKFRVKAPGYMTEKVDTIKTGLGSLAYHTFFYQSPDKEADNLFYMVSYCDYPQGSIHSDSTELLEAFFDVTVEESAFSISGDVIYSNTWDWQGYPGRIWRVAYLKGAAVIKTRAFVAENRYYTMQTVMLQDKTLNEMSDQFFDSFYLLEGAASGN